MRKAITDPDELKDQEPAPAPQEEKPAEGGGKGF